MNKMPKIRFRGCYLRLRRSNFCFAAICLGLMGCAVPPATGRYAAVGGCLIPDDAVTVPVPVWAYDQDQIMRHGSGCLLLVPHSIIVGGYVVVDGRKI